MAFKSHSLFLQSFENLHKSSTSSYIRTNIEENLIALGTDHKTLMNLPLSFRASLTWFEETFHRRSRLRSMLASQQRRSTVNFRSVTWNTRHIFYSHRYFLEISWWTRHVDSTNDWKKNPMHRSRRLCCSEIGDESAREGQSTRGRCGLCPYSQFPIPLVLDRETAGKFMTSRFLRSVREKEAWVKHGCGPSCF